MPDDNGQQAGQNKDGQGQQQAQQQAFTPPATQADLDRIISERLGRERAKFADYDDVKAKAAEFDKIAEGQKTEAQKAAERADKAEREAAEHKGALLRLRVATSKGLPPDLSDRLRGDSEDELNADADRLLALVGGQQQQPFDHGPRQTAPANDMNSLILRGLTRR
jgi:hypothetical protein